MGPVPVQVPGIQPQPYFLIRGTNWLFLKSSWPLCTLLRKHSACSLGHLLWYSWCAHACTKALLQTLSFQAVPSAPELPCYRDTDNYLTGCSWVQLAALVKTHNVPKELVLNTDQTGMPFRPSYQLDGQRRAPSRSHPMALETNDRSQQTQPQLRQGPCYLSRSLSQARLRACLVAMCLGTAGSRAGSGV